MPQGEKSIIDRIQMARGTKEPVEAEPTPNTDPVDVSKVEAPVKDEIVDEIVNEEPITEELEAKDDQALESDDDEEELYVEYKGREINLKDVEEWEQGSLRQADYTRKTQELADQRKAFEDEKEQFTANADGLTNSVATLEAMIAEETLSAEDLKELREYDPEEFIKYTDKMAARKNAVSNAKVIQPAAVDVEAERAKLWDANPTWLDNGKQSKAFTADMELLQTYAQDSGYSNEEVAQIQSAHHWQTLIDAAKYRALKVNNAAIEKRVRLAPVTTKPKQAAQSTVVSEIKKAESRLKRTGKTEDAVKLRQLRRKLA